MDELIPLANLEAVLQEYAKEVRNLYQDKLILHDRIASGALLNSVEFEVATINGDFVVSLILEDWWKYVEYDTRPHWPPVNALLNWVKVKPVIPSPDRNGRIPTPQQLAYLIGRKIAEKGTKGDGDLGDAVKEVNERYKEKIIAAMYSDMNDYIYKVVIQPYFG